jgi:SAM-dependent methyltransferase
MQMVHDLAGVPLEDLRVLDVACGEGVYAIETALSGAKVLALDARTERMEKGAAAATRLKLSNLRFEQCDVRKVNLASHGEFDVIYFLGILYHLDVPDVFGVLESIYGMCRDFLIVDTHIALTPSEQVTYKGRSYSGYKAREHDDNDSESARRSRLLASLDNTFSFMFTRESLVRLLKDIGFSSVFECHVPLEPFKPDDRVTLLAIRKNPIEISAYPWINKKTEDEVETIVAAAQPVVTQAPAVSTTGLKGNAKKTVNTLIRPFGWELRRIDR